MTRVVGSILLSFFVAACGARGSRARDAGPAVAPRPNHVEFAVPEGTTLGPVVDAPRFRIEARPSGDEGYPVGRQGSFSIEVVAKDGSTFPRDRPAHLQLRAPAGVGLSASRFDRTAAPVNTESRILFEVPFLPMETGDGTIDGVVHLVACREGGCEEHDAHVRLVLAIH